MSDWKSYYEQTKAGRPDPALEFACAQVDPSLPLLAVDCGCGAGRGAAFLLEKGFRVHGFDADPNSAVFCNERFADNDQATFSTATFTSFDYPETSLLAASFSLFFCPEAEFDAAWQKITRAISPQGIFCGTFLGPKDTWAKLGHVTDKPELKVFAHSGDALRDLFTGFTILENDTRDYDGRAASGERKHWHTTTIVARRESDD